MELDGYSKKLAIAFEHQGSQHYTLSTKYIRDNSKLKERIRDDKKKQKLCEENGISLFIIPSIMHITKIDEVKNVIESEAKRLNVKLPKDFYQRQIDYNKAYEVDYHKSKLNEIKKVAQKNEGKCISKKYINDRTKLRFQCKNGHVWDATPKDILNGHWCFKCAVKKRGEKQKLTIPLLNKKVSGKGKCISSNYLGYEIPLEWECNNGHVFSASPRLISRGGWCPECRKEQNSFLSQEKRNLLVEIANRHNGKLLSTKYENEKKELKWQCSKRHVWLAPAERIKNSGSWCPICAGNKAFSINYVNKYISQYGGKCLSTEYKNYRTMLKFMCKNGHIFENRFINVKNGSWCPICKKEQKKDAT